MSKIFFRFNNFEWDGVEKIDYKRTDGEGPVTFNRVTRQNLVTEEAATDFHLRYFECAVDGFSTLEKHNHEHVIIIARGRGKIIVNDEIFDVKPMDMVVTPPYAKHQLINDGNEPFGFFCTVDAERDKFQLLTKEEIENLKANPNIASFLKVPDRYFD